MSKTLEVLFQSKARVKLLKFFFRNTSGGYSMRDIVQRVRERPEVVRKEVRGLIKIGTLLKK